MSQTGTIPEPDSSMLKTIADNKEAQMINFTVNIASIDTIDRTDSRLNSIIELPYCPSDSITYSSGVFSFDNNIWELSGALQMLKLKNLNADFLRTLTTYETVDNMSYTLTAADLLPTSARNDEMESKIYHSDFNTIK